MAEGRDITTVVAPRADIRVLLTAREEVRKARRAAQADEVNVGKDDVSARDKADSKVTHFTEAAAGVTTVDNSEMTMPQTLEAFERMVENSIDERASPSTTTFSTMCSTLTMKANLTGFESDTDETLDDYELSDERP